MREIETAPALARAWVRVSIFKATEEEEEEKEENSAPRDKEMIKRLENSRVLEFQVGEIGT